LIVSESEFQDAAVVLIGHGSSKNDQSGQAVYRQAEELRRRNLFAEVREAFWKQDPKLLEVAASLKAARVFFVPMFVSEGYFSEGVIPKALDFDLAHCRRRPKETLTSPSGPNSPSLEDKKKHSKLESPDVVSYKEWLYCKPVGTHERISNILFGRAGEVVKQFPFPRAPKESEITLFIAGHGTEKDENSRKSVERHAELIRALNVYAAVEAVFLEEEPKISRCYEMAKTRNIVVAPFFIGEGMHVQEDIPILLGEPERVVKKRLQEGKSPWRNPTEKKGKLVWYAESVGNDPALAEVIVERVKEADKEVLT
jgi:sirohydrochlorin cobaltochelatase